MRPRMVLSAALALCAAVLAPSAAAAPPTLALEESYYPSGFGSLNAPTWTKVDKAFDSAARTPISIRSACLPRGGPGRTLLTDSERLGGRRLGGLATRALAAPEVMAVDRMLTARGFRPVPFGAYGRASNTEKFVVLPYADPLGRAALLGFIAGPNGSRRAEARLVGAPGTVLRANRPPRPGTASQTSRSVAAPPKARAAVSVRCLRNCARGGARCGRGVVRCRNLLAVPLYGPRLFVACVVIYCGPEALRCMRRCF